MNNIDLLYKTLEKSSVSLIGYTTRTERIKDEFISKLPHINVGYIDSSFSLVQFLRDYKIDNVLYNSNTLSRGLNWLVLDICNIIATRNSDEMEFNVSLKNKIIEVISYQIRNFKGNNLKLIITCPLYTSPNSELTREELSFTGGSKPLLVSDLSFIVKEDKIKVIKNRFDSEFSSDVSFLKNYNYICSYEYIK